MKVGSLDIRYYTGGHGHPLVIVHGGGDGARSWRQNMDELAKHYTIYVPDLPGFGRSQPDGERSIPELVTFIDDFTKRLGLKKFHLVGHSIGGGIALHYSLQFPGKISKLVLANSMYLGEDIAPWVRILSSSAMIKTVGLAAHKLLEGIKFLLNLVYAPLHFLNPLPRVKLNFGNLMTTLAEQTVLLQNQFPGMLMPVLLVWGENDAIVPVSNAYTAQQLMPDWQLHIFKGCGHSVYRQKASAFSQLIIKFLG